VGWAKANLPGLEWGKGLAAVDCTGGVSFAAGHSEPLKTLPKALLEQSQSEISLVLLMPHNYNLAMAIPPEMLRIYLLGKVSLEVGGKTSLLPQRERLLCLFVRLVLQSGQPQSRKTLAFSLWPDEPEANALANLRRHLYLLRRALPAAAQKHLLISSQTVMWSASDHCWLDVNAFENESVSIDELEEIAELYRGDLAPGVDLDEVIVGRREELRMRYLGLLKKLTQACLEQNDLQRALKWARKLAAQDLWDEEAIRLQMMVEALSGNRAGALAIYQSLAQRLNSELRTQPMPETMALYSDILKNRQLRTFSPRQTPSPTIFIGRTHELAQLETALRALRNHQGRVVLISGEAGVGKTYLLQETFRRSFDSEDQGMVRLFWGHCPPPAGDAPPPPYAPWRQIFSATAPLLAHSGEIPPDWLNWLLLLVPDLGLLRPGLLTPSQPDAVKLRTACRQALNFLAIDRPLVLVIEDAHWADHASLELLADLAETCQTLPFVIILTHRPTAALPALLNLKRQLRQRRCVQEVHLQAFNEQESRLFLEKMLGRRVLTPALWDEINHYAQGLPLLLREAVESLRQAQHASPQPLSSLRDAICVQLAQLDSSARQMLEAAAVLGFAFSGHELQTMLGLSPGTYALLMDSLQSRGLVLPATTPGYHDYTFSHQLIHQVIRNEIPTTQAVHLHKQAACALENLYAGRVGFADQIATHYQAAQQPLQAARFWLIHAQEMIDLAAFEQAEEAIERATALVSQQPAAHQSREVLAQAAMLRGVLAHYSGNSGEALRHLDFALAASRDFPALHAAALVRQASVLYTSDRYSEAYQVASQSIELARALGEKAIIERALNVRGIIALMIGRPYEAICDLEQTVTDEAIANPSTQTLQSLNHLGTALVFVQDYRRAQEILNKTVELSARAGLRRVESAALMMLGQIALNQGRYSGAVDLYSKAIAAAETSYLPGMWGKFAGRGAALLRMGRLEEARQDFERGLQVALQVRTPYGELLMRTYLTLTALAQGQAAADSLVQLEAEALALDLHPVIYVASLGQAGLWRLLGEWPAALSACQRAVRAAQASGVSHFVQHAQLEEMITRGIADRVDLTALEQLAQSAQAAGELPHQARASLALALALRRQGKFSAALSAAQRALMLARACPDQPLIGESLLVLCSLQQALAQTEQAQMGCNELRALAARAYAPLLLGLDAGTALRRVVLLALSLP